MKKPEKIIVIGASAGALEALSLILMPLPGDYPFTILIVVHIPSDKDSLLAPLLDLKCQIQVAEAEDKEPLETGRIYIAPPDYHLLLEKDLTLSLSSEEEILFSRPSIDVLFESAADACGADLTGVVLTGANEDGSKGLLAIHESGGKAIIQDPFEAHASAMPRAAMKACPGAAVMKLNDIADYLMNLARRA